VAQVPARGEHGARARVPRRQRPLWASTSTKDPKSPDVYYVEHLIAPHSVDTIPPGTLEAFRDHGDPKVRIRDGRDGAHRALEDLAGLGVDFDEVTRELEEEGVQKFARSYDDLLATIRSKQAREAAPGPRSTSAINASRSAR